MTEDPHDLGAVQPERKRRYDQLRPGQFRGTLSEVAWGGAALLHEQWSCGLRVRCDRPSGYVAFTAVAAMGASARWCGAALEPDTVLRVTDPWELVSFGNLDLFSFAVDGTRLRETTIHLAGGACSPTPLANGTARTPRAARLAHQVRHLLHMFESAPLPAAPLAAAEADLLHLAARLDRRSGFVPVERLLPRSARRNVVRQVEEYVDATAGEAPTVATLCKITGVSERTLEYAFRENLDTTPLRYLKLRRLNQVRRALLDSDSPAVSVTESAFNAGIYDLGRFAAEYRRLFGELPSETLRRASARRSPSSAIADSAYAGFP